MKRICKQAEAFKILIEVLRDKVNELPDSPHKRFKYCQFQNLVYLIVFRKTASAIRKEWKLKKRESLISKISEEYLEKCCCVICQIIQGIKEGKNYKEIKGELNGRYILYRQCA